MAASHSSRRGSTGVVVVLILMGMAALGTGGVWYWNKFQGGEEERPLTHVASRGPFDHIVLEQGEVESSRNVEITCEVKSRNTQGTAILWVVEEGAYVKEGDRLVQLDSSSLEQELANQRITVSTAEALVITARSTLEQAKIAKDEYLKGTFAQEESTIESEILIAEENLSRAQETATYSEELAAFGFETPQQLRANQFAVKQRQVELKLAQQKLETLREITKKKMLVGFDADIEAAEAQLKAEEKSFEEEKIMLAEIEQQIKNCEIFAPQDGQVVHANQTSSRGNAEFVVEPGAMVRERQVIIRLPDPTQMRVSAKINEARVPLVEEGMPVAISIGAINSTLQGRVTKVNKYAEPSSWFSSQVKEYATYIEIDDPPDAIRSGMTAEVRIFVEQLEDVLQMPVQAAYEHKGHFFCLIYRPDGPWETREVKIGASNDKMLVIEGLEAGDEVVLNPRHYRDRLELPDLPDIPEVEFDKSKRSPGAERAGGIGPLRAGGPQGRGGPRGGPGGGGPPSADAIVSRTFQRSDADQDGKLSPEEIQQLDARWRDRVLQADSNGDGSVDRAELKSSTEARLRSGRGPGGPGGGRGGPSRP